MGTVVGSRAVTLKRAIIIAGIFEFLGAFLVGSHVTNTVRKGIIDPLFFSAQPELLAYGMFSALLAAAIFQHIATLFSIPVSTTHAIVGAIFGFGIISAGFDSVNWSKIGLISSGWIISPMIGGLVSFTLFNIIRKLILAKEHPYQAAIKVEHAEAAARVIYYARQLGGEKPLAPNSLEKLHQTHQKIVEMEAGVYSGYCHAPECQISAPQESNLSESELERIVSEAVKNALSET